MVAVCLLVGCSSTVSVEDRVLSLALAGDSKIVEAYSKCALQYKSMECRASLIKER